LEKPMDPHPAPVPLDPRQGKPGVTGKPGKEGRGAGPAGARASEGGAFALVADELAQVETLLRARMDSDIGSIPDVGAHLLLAGGKRLRPVLAALAARATGTAIDIGLAVGVAGELIHTATLYHDDVVDDGRVRRGRPAARMVFGNGIVVLVGDFCLARALETVTATGALPVVQSLAATVTEMAEGEVAQLERAGNPEVTTAQYFDVIDRKTASLIAWCARVGGATDPATDAALGRYGRAVGRAFQIADDILDCAGAESVTGKSVAHDLQEGKLTLPVLLACDADPAVRERIRRELGEGGMSAEAARQVLALVQQAGGVDRARSQALALVDGAVAELAVLPASPYRDALREMARLSVERVS
jgi:octaprenyl-diphosphate synthase